MRQLWMFIFQGMFVSVCSLIDTAFGNGISMDSICVLSAYTVITWITYCTYSVGVYGYRTLLSNVRSCFLVEIVVALMVSIVVIAFSKWIPFIYSLTEYQNHLFSECLVAHGVSIIFLAMGEFLYNYVQLKYKNTLIWWSNIVFYTIMFLLDWLVVKNNLELNYIVYATGISYVLYDVILLIFSGILKEKDSITLMGIKECFKHGGRILLDRLLGKVATVVFNIYASKLGTELYAIHSICYSLSTNTENITNACYNFQIVRLSEKASTEEKYKVMDQLGKKYYWKVSIISTCFCCILMLFIHGGINLSKLLLYVFIYASQAWMIQLYENHRAFLTSIKETRCLMFGGLFGILVRIPITLVSYYSGLGLIGFGFAPGIDFLVRGIYLKLCSKNILQK